MAHAQFDVVIVGGGHGGAHTAIALRQEGFSGSICICERDPEFPYERPPLSKEYLAGEKTFERLQIRPERFWAEQQIVVRTSSEITSLDPVSKSVRMADGAVLHYTNLVWATGGTARQLSCPGGSLACVRSIRTKQDVDYIMQRLEAGASKIVVIGGGYIGLEAAAVFRKLGNSVTLLEAQNRVLARVAGQAISSFFESEHARQGVDVRLAVNVVAIEAVEDGKASVVINDGERIECDIVIVGVGIEPSVSPLLLAGIDGDKIGIQVDHACRTSDPNIFAIGDCAVHANAFAQGQMVRVESVQNAADMAKVVAKALCGQQVAYTSTPWFWSNQYDLKLQTVGISTGHDEVVLRGDPTQRSFSVIYMRAGKVLAIDCVNAVKDYVQARKLVEQGATISPSELADTNRPLKEMLSGVE